VPDLLNPQSLNPYSYCLNNPLKYVDPSGNFPDDPYAAMNYAYNASYLVTGGVHTFQALTEVSFSVNAYCEPAVVNVVATYVGSDQIIVDKGVLAQTLWDNNYFAASILLTFGSEDSGPKSNAGGFILAGGMASSGLAFRYVDGKEMQNILKNNGTITNKNWKDGSIRDIYVTDEKYNTVKGAENGLQIGSKNPGGKKPSPEYRVTFVKNSVKYDYWGPVKGGTANEGITKSEIAIGAWEKLRK
jgi:hypothetical protein